MALTRKEETFCQEVVKQPSYSAAYRIAYNASRMTDKTINEKASIMMAKGKIKARVDELKEKVSNKMIYTLEQSMKRDIKLIERYEAALDVLEDDKSDNKQTEVAERTIRYIGANAYNSAQERLSKQSGWFEKDKNPKAEIIINTVTAEEAREINKALEDEY